MCVRNCMLLIGFNLHIYSHFKLYLLMSSLKMSQLSQLLIVLNQHHLNELPGFESNSEKAYETEPNSTISESPQQHQPNSQMAKNTCTDMVIHFLLH